MDSLELRKVAFNWTPNDRSQFEKIDIPNGWLIHSIEM